MTVSISSQYVGDVNQSLAAFIKNTTYIRSGASSYSLGTILSFFPGIVVNLGYVDNLDNIPLPSLAILPPTVSGGMSEGYGEHLQTISFHYTVNGYVGRQKSHGDNLAYRDQLAEDLRSLFEDQEYIALKTFDGSSVVSTDGDIGVENFTLNFIPPAQEPEASRYRFSFDLDVEYLKKI